jgi:hypothetical protein
MTPSALAQALETRGFERYGRPSIPPSRIAPDAVSAGGRAASIDQVSGGRFLFGIGGGWKVEEMADDGTASDAPSHGPLGDKAGRASVA